MRFDNTLDVAIVHGWGSFTNVNIFKFSKLFFPLGGSIGAFMTGLFAELSNNSMVR
jgi:hypothetical protein